MLQASEASALHGATDADALPPLTHRMPAQRWRLASAQTKGDNHSSSGVAAMAAMPTFATVTTISEEVAEEVPVALVYNGISHAVMLASPDNLEDFACGFSLAEGIVDDVTELYDIDILAHARGIEVRITLAAVAMQRLKMTRRIRTGKTGCGLCGIESLEQFAAGTDIDRLHAGVGCVQAKPGSALTTAALHRAMDDLARCQALHAATGATHAAGWSTWEGSVVLAREDVGRHNALDKLVGAMARERVDVAGGFVVVTSRASFEMVQKAARAGVGVLAAVSAPTAMAVRLAEAAGVTLAGFVRTGQNVVYTHGHRFAPC